MKNVMKNVMKNRNFLLIRYFFVLMSIYSALSCRPVKTNSTLNEFTEAERTRYTLLLAELELNPRCYTEDSNPLSLFSPYEIEHETVDYDAFESAVLTADHIPCSSRFDDERAQVIPPKDLLADKGNGNLNLNYVGVFKDAIKLLGIGAKQGKLLLKGKNGGAPFKTYLAVRTTRTTLEIKLPTFIKEGLKQPIPLNERYRGENLPGNSFGWLVKYLTPQEQAAYKITIRDGKLYAANGKVFSTSSASTVHSNDPRAVFVVNKDGNIYASLIQTIGRFHHSSLAAGDSVLTAGEMSVSNGKLVLISNKSGHYRPSKDSVMDLLSALKKVGVDVSKVQEDFW